MSETVIGEVCPACGHNIHEHFEDVTKHVQCLVRTRHVTTKGVIGLEFDVSCECEDYAMPPPEAPTRDERMRRVIEALKRDASSADPEQQP
jgi:hypothetical protein